MDTQQEFKIYCSEITKSLQTNKTKTGKNQPLILEGVASTSDIDLEGDLITPQCIENFKLQATNCNIHNNHNVGLDDVIGTVLEVLDSDSQTLKIKFSILPLFREHIEECIDNGVKLGLSIGGTIVDYDTAEDGLKIKSMMLHEISLTPLPANWNTMGTVVREGQGNVIEAKCLNGVCKQFLNKIEKTIENTDNMATKAKKAEKEEQPITEEFIVGLINEALNNFVQENNETVTEERVAEIIDEKLKEFVKQAKAMEEAEIKKAQKKEKAEEKPEIPPELQAFMDEVMAKIEELQNKVNSEEKKSKTKAQKEKSEEDEKDKLIAELQARIEELESAEKKKAQKAEKEEEEEEKPGEEEEEEKEEESKEKKEKEGKKSLTTELTAETLGTLISEAISSQKSQEPEVDIGKELQTLKNDLQSEIKKAMSETKKDIEKNLFDGLMKENVPRGRGDDAQLKKFLKAKNEKDLKKSSTLNVHDIAKTLSRD